MWKPALSCAPSRRRSAAVPLGDLNCTAAARFAARFPLARREQRSNMLGFARWNQPLMSIALHKRACEPVPN